MQKLIVCVAGLAVALTGIYLYAAVGPGPYPGQRLNRSGSGFVCDADCDTGWECGDTDDVCTYETNSTADFAFADNEMVCKDAVALKFGTGEDDSIQYSAVQTPDAMVIGVGTDSRAVIVCEEADKGTDFALAQQTNPTFCVHSAATTAAHLSCMTHDQTDMVLESKTGDIVAKPAGNDFTIGTGAAGIDYALKINGEDSDAILQWMEDEQRLDLTGAFKVSSTVEVTGISTLAAASSTVPAFLLDRIRFCGNGPDNGAETYVSPVPYDDTEADYISGGAGCDGEDDTTIGNADDKWPDLPNVAFKAVGMVCTAVCTGATAANDAIVFKLYDDTAAVTGMTCTTAELGGDGVAAQCSVTDTTPETIAAGSLLAVGIDDTNDDCNDAGDDFDCYVFTTF